MKRIVVYYPDGTEQELTTPPALQTMQQLVGGLVEQVRFLDRLDRATVHGRYSYMYVNEEGLIQGLPRNAQATAHYQRNVRLAFSDHPNPFAAAKAHYRAQMEQRGLVVLHSTTEPPGYADDPYIAGPAIVFEGWTCTDIEAAYNAGEEED